MMARYKNVPVWIDPARYEAELGAYIGSARRSAHVRSVWTMGSIGAPGISDLDAIVLVDDDFPAEEAKYLGVVDRDRKIFCHAALIIPTRLWQDLPQMKWTSNLTLRWARDEASACGPRESDPRFLFHAMLFDNNLGRRLQWELSRTAKEIDARAWARGLWSLTHAETLCEWLQLDLPPVVRVALDQIREFRRAWNENHRWDPTRFQPLYERFGEINDVILRIAAAESARLLEGDRTGPTPRRIAIENRRYHFQPDDRTIQVRISRVRFGRKQRTYYDIHMPESLAGQLLAYVDCQEKSGTEYGAFLRARQRGVRAHTAFMAGRGRDSRGQKLRTIVPVPGLSSRMSTITDSLVWLGRR